MVRIYHNQKLKKSISSIIIISICTFVPNKSFRKLLNISPTNYIYSEILHSEFSNIEVWFTDQNSVPLEKEDRINFTLVINYRRI